MTRSISTPLIVYLVPLWLRVFNAARRTLTSERNTLGLKVLEAYECLRWWWENGVMTGAVTGCPIVPRAQIGAQLITALLGDAALVEDDVEWPIFYFHETVWIFPVICPVAVIP